MDDSTRNDLLRQDWREKSGALPISMTNDYLFRALCQKDSVALAGLVCAVLHWEQDQVRSVQITNPILLGKAIDDKEYILDVHVTLNNSIVMNLEMQVVSNRNWTDRSLQYLCRRFDMLCHGQDYDESSTAIHVGILDFDPFEKRSGLLESYRMMSRNSQIIYSEKIQLYVLCLLRAERATQEDIRYHTDLWAKFFKATTWEDLKMLARDEEAIASAVSTVNKLLEDDEVRARVQAREDYNFWERVRQTREKRNEERLRKQEEDLQKQEEEIQRRNEEIQRKDEEMRRQEEEISRQEEEISRQVEEISRQEEEISRQVEEISRQEEEISRQVEEISRQEEEISRQEEEISRQEEEISRQVEEISRQKEDMAKLQDELAAERKRYQDLVTEMEKLRNRHTNQDK